MISLSNKKNLLRIILNNPSFLELRHLSIMSCNYHQIHPIVYSSGCNYCKMVIKGSLVLSGLT